MMIWALVLPLMASLSVLVFWLIFKDSPIKYEHLSINNMSYEKSIKRQEVVRTIWTLLIFAMVGGAIDYLEYLGWAKVYTGISDYGYPYLILSIFILLGINDIYFYLSHRFLHWKPVFKTVHFMHHQSHTPNPFSAFSFHPIEGLIQIGFLPIVVLILPLNTFVLLFFVAFLMLMSVYGHSGYELRPQKPKAFEIFNNSIHHNQHHRYVNYNFGLYLNLWDRLFKTNHPNYEKESERFKSQQQEEISG